MGSARRGGHNAERNFGMRAPLLLGLAPMRNGTSFIFTMSDSAVSSARFQSAVASGRLMLSSDLRSAATAKSAPTNAAASISTEPNR